MYKISRFQFRFLASLASAGEVLPLLLLPGREDHPDGGDPGQLVMHLLLQGVALQVEVLQGGQEAQRLHLNVGDEVLAGDDLDEGGDLCQDGRHLDEGVAGDVHSLQGGAVGQLVREAGHAVVGHVQVCGESSGEICWVCFSS